ncbi:hypothetical protein MMC14_003682, partial [Varicellaria rhodocarpa]|nr:hypothetical protein [Varicellaria rhodocarpa]
MAGSSSLIVPLASPPDFSICDSLFARGLGPRDCFLASNSPLTAGELPAPFYLDPSIGQLHKLPFVMIH